MRGGRYIAAMSPTDSNRPPVLAHQRFVEDNQSFAGLDLAQRFRRIHDTNLWGAAASASGLGSEMDATATLRAELPLLFGRLGVTSLLDAPCGDAGWINHADLGVRITGVDIVPPLIEAPAGPRRRRGNHRRISPRRHFTGSAAPVRRDFVPRLPGASVVCQYRADGGELSELRRGVADRDHLPGMADQS